MTETKTKISQSDFPFKMPYIVENTWGVIAFLTAVFIWPVMAFVWILGEKILTWYYNSSDIDATEFHIIFLITISGMIIITPTLLIAARISSRYYFKCVRWYLDNDKIDSAETYIRAFSHVVSYRDWKRNSWFREFVRNHNLISEVYRLSEFNNRFPN